MIFMTANELKKKKYPVYFYLLLFLMPFLILAILEFGLRITGYGSDYSVVQHLDIQSEKYYTINRTIAHKYFTGGHIAIPDARNDVFRVQKLPSTLRIFCLGGSTTAGWPFLYNGTFPSLLRDRLQAQFPDKDVEVINFGISAINSYSVLDITKELVHYEPDLFLIYMGHNEFYGAFGVASTQGIGQNRAVVKLYLKCRSSRLFQLLGNSFSLLKKVILSKGKNAKATTLMQAMVGNDIIRFQSRQYEIARKVFQANLSETIDMIRKQNIPVLVGTLVSNIGDHEPFQSVFSEATADTTQWKKLFLEGNTEETKSNFEKALKLYQETALVDSMPAILAYSMGTCYQNLGDMQRATHFYQRARDLDALRFRASTEFNKIIRDVCQKKQVPVAEIEELFKKNSPHGLVGKDLVLEHLHPTLRGYSLMAEAFYKEMTDFQFFIDNKSQGRADSLSDFDYLKHALVTDMEMEMANKRIQQLTSRWPFKNTIIMRKPGETDYESVLQKVVDKLLVNSLSWNDASYQLADYWMKKGQYREAENYYLSLIKIRPMNYYPYIYLGNLLYAQKKVTEAEQSYLKSLEFSPNLPFAYAKLGLLYVGQNQPQKAHSFLEKAVTLGGHNSQFSITDLNNARYLLAASYAQTQQYEKARIVAETALRSQPNNEKINSLLKKINMAIRFSKSQNQ